MEQNQNNDARTDQQEVSHDTDGQPPAMSVILPVDQPDTIRGVLNHLKKQTIASHLEIVLATPTPSAFEELRSAQFRISPDIDRLPEAFQQPNQELSLEALDPALLAFPVGQVVDVRIAHKDIMFKLLEVGHCSPG